MARAGDGACGAYKERLVVADREVAEDRALERDGDVCQQGGAGGPEAPVGGSEFVDRIARLFSKEPGNVQLIPAKEVQANG